MQEDKMSCLSCSIEALLMAKTYLMESLQNRTKEEKLRKLREAVRELKHAESHLIMKYPDKAGEVRKLRKKFESCIFAPDYEACNAKAIQEVLGELEDKIEQVNKLGLITDEELAVFSSQQETINNMIYKAEVNNLNLENIESENKQKQFKKGEKREKIMAIKSGKTIASILGAQFGAIIGAKAIDYIAAKAGYGGRPAYQSVAEWGKVGLGVVSIIAGTYTTSPTWDLPLIIAGGQLTVNSMVAMAESLISTGGTVTPPAGVRYRLASAPISVAPVTTVAPTPSLGGKVVDYTGGV